MDWPFIIAFALLIVYHYQSEAKLASKLDEVEVKFEKAKQKLESLGVPTGDL